MRRRRGGQLERDQRRDDRHHRGDRPDGQKQAAVVPSARLWRAAARSAAIRFAGAGLALGVRWVRLLVTGLVPYSLRGGLSTNTASR